MDVKYIPQDWEKTEEGIGNLVGLGKWGKGVIDKLKKLDDIVEDAKDSIGEYDVDGVVHLQHTSQKSKYQDLYEDYEVLHDFSEKVGELIDTEIDQPFYEDIDAFAQAMRDLTIEKYTTSNTIGAKETIATPMGGSYVQTTERVKDKITVNDIFTSNNVFATNLKAEFEAYTKAHPEENVSYTTYQKAALNSRAFTYDSIKDQQQNKEFWRDIAILGTTIVLAVATPFFPPAGIALGALVTSVGAMELSSAATGKDWMTGRKLDTSERWLRGVLAFVDVLPAAKGLHAFGNVTTGLKAGTSTTTIKNASKVGLEEGGSRLKQADNLLTERAQNANKLSGEKLENLELNIEKKTPVENAPVFEKKSAEFFDGLNLKSGAKDTTEEVRNVATKYSYNMIENPGPLAEMRGNPASNFLAGKYNVKTLDEDTTLYRSGKKGGLTIPGEEQNALGQWFTREPAESVAKVRIDSAVKAQWIDPKTGVLTGTSPLESTYAIKIPKGTTIYEGPVGYQGGLYLGGENCNQIFISEPWKINGVEPLSETPIK
ncbi:hypothetical protein CN326_04060 [Bacillus sp. AFS018417]|uniref:pre-toxin TG domain-containing protein n=1 Tax=Bacillus sp. AFS018417 TaxID=2033491 RepID=UPI000BF8577F|nr:pre-toxin TG domain-containing protein [Bacillus sp. AFS018417]PEZ08854.1 hypothetical protein CN326_04060 [Bacillus sp. AFS018417]